MIYRLDNPRAWRTYVGGKQIDILEGVKNPKDSNYPEEWIMSVVEAKNGARSVPGEGYSHIPALGGVTLKDYLDQNGEAVLGKAHVKRFGTNPGVLVKMIDSLERLTTQCHPSRENAMKLFNSPYGKTECWYILGGDDPNIYFGFKEGMTRERFVKCFNEQDIQGMLDCMHHIHVKPGDTILIPGGLPHAIGATSFLVEIQEPTDYTIRVERTTPGGTHVDDILCHQGLGFDRMFDCFDFEGVSEAKTRERCFLKPTTLISNASGVCRELVGYSDTDCFRMLEVKVSPKSRFNAGSYDAFAAVYVLNGKGSLMESSNVLEAATGNQFFVAYGSGELVFCNNGDQAMTAFICFGPKA